MDDYRKIGLFLTAFGGLFVFLGVMMLFDRGLLAIGNLLFVAGLLLIIGIANAAAFFWVAHRRRGAVLFFLGITMVLLGWAFIGFVVELFGVLNLFGDFFPIIFASIQALPVVGPLFTQFMTLPIVRQISDRMSGRAPLPV